MSFKVGQRTLKIGSPSYFIADIAANHDGELSRAIDLIYLAKKAGADCAKFQHFEAKTIVSETGFRKLNKIETHQSNWKKSVSEIYDQYHTKREWDAELIRHCKKAEIDFMTTPYNLDAVSYFKDHMHAYKVGSGDITYRPLLDALNKNKKAVFLATGAADIDDIDAALELLNDCAICVMQCNTNYTGSLENFRYVNLNVLKTFRVKYPNLILGFSDHTPGHAAVLGAITLGAVAIEKHFTDDNCREGPDHSFALNPMTWRDMVDRARELELALGDGIKRIEENERNTVIVQRRSIRSAKQIQVGELIRGDDLVFLRPCEQDDISPMYCQQLVGMRATRTIEKGESIKWSDLETS